MQASAIEIAVDAALAARAGAEPHAFREREGVVLILGTIGQAEWAAVVVVRNEAVVSLREFESHDEAVAAATP